MNKLLILIIFLSGLLSCERPKDNVADQFLLGKWVISETMLFQNNDDSANAKCNVCPQITFFKNNHGFIKRPGKILTYFDWEFDEGKLMIKRNDIKITDNAINDGTYKTTFGGRRQFNQITLSDTVRNIDYILKR
jgi:hypothetical protein